MHFAVDPQQRDAFLREPRTAVLTTLRKDGTPHSVPVWFRWDGQDIRIITDRGSAKHRNLLANPRASLCIDEREGRFRYITVEGAVREAGPVTREERLALHTLYRGAEAAEQIVAAGGHERMVLLLLRPDRWMPSR